MEERTDSDEYTTIAISRKIVMPQVLDAEADAVLAAISPLLMERMSVVIDALVEAELTALPQDTFAYLFTWNRTPSPGYALGRPDFRAITASAFYG